MQLSVLPDQVHTAAGHISCCVVLMPCGPLKSGPAIKTPSVYVVGSLERAGVCMGEEGTGNNMFLGVVGTTKYPLGNLGKCARKV